MTEGRPEGAPKASLSLGCLYPSGARTQDIQMNEANVIYIGQKPIMNYVLAAGKRLADGGSSVLVQARGRSISKAVDVALIAVDRSKGELTMGEIGISTETLPGADGSPLKVSCIKIVLRRP